MPRSLDCSDIDLRKIPIKVLLCVVYHYSRRKFLGVPALVTELIYISQPKAVEDS
jgi:hypothetical protein